MSQHHMIDLTSVQSIAVIAGVLLSFFVVVCRQRIVKHIRRVFANFRKTSQLVHENENLTGRLASAEERNIEWEQQYENLDRLRIAIGEQLELLKKEIEDVRRRLSAKDEMLHLLQYDRDALLTWGRLLIGQMHASQIKPDYPSPPLRSIVAVPVPETFNAYTIAHEKS